MRLLKELGYVCESIPQHGVTLPLIPCVPPDDREGATVAAMQPKAASS